MTSTPRCMLLTTQLTTRTTPMPRTRIICYKYASTLPTPHPKTSTLEPGFTQLAIRCKSGRYFNLPGANVMPAPPLLAHARPGPAPVQFYRNKPAPHRGTAGHRAKMHHDHVGHLPLHKSPANHFLTKPAQFRANARARNANRS